MVIEFTTQYTVYINVFQFGIAFAMEISIGWQAYRGDKKYIGNTAIYD